MSKTNHEIALIGLVGGTVDKLPRARLILGNGTRIGADFRAEKSRPLPKIGVCATSWQTPDVHPEAEGAAMLAGPACRIFDECQGELALFAQFPLPLRGGGHRPVQFCAEAARACGQWQEGPKTLACRHLSPATEVAAGGSKQEGRGVF